MSAKPTPKSAPQAEPDAAKPEPAPPPVVVVPVIQKPAPAKPEDNPMRIKRVVF